MNKQPGFFEFICQQSGKLLEQVLVHTGITFVSLLLALLAGVGLGILISRRRWLAGLVLGVAGVLQTVPSIALLGCMIPLLGIGAQPAIVALFLYALLPIIRNTYTGITSVNPSVTEAALAMGMTPAQVLRRVQLPLAMPVLLAGIRTATVINVGVATLAAYIGAGGLGEFIFGGIALNNTAMILAGAVPAALLAILFDFLLARVQRMNLKKMRPLPWALPLAALLLSGFYLLPKVYGSQLLAGFTPEFMGRMDGNLGLKKIYGLHLRTVVINDMILYKAIAAKKLDVISGSSTDGRVKAYNLVVLEDDKHLFPPYYAAPIVRLETLQRFPELESILNKLAGRINDSVMTALNYRVDYLKQPPEKVAKDFLIQTGLWHTPANRRQGTITIGSKIFGDGYILANAYKMLIEGYTGLQVVTKTGLGGTKICFDALVNRQIDLYPEYTGTGLLVILQASKQTVDSLGGIPSKVYDYVQAAFTSRYGIKWMQPIGFNNTYALMMRREQANTFNIQSVSLLKQYSMDH